MGAAAASDFDGGGPVARAIVLEDSAQEKPTWAAELTELVRAMSLQSTRGNARPRRDPPVCWTCGQPGHISVQCPKRAGGQGNASGPCLGGTTQALSSVSQPVLLPVDGAHQYSRGSGAPLPPEADDGAEVARVVGWTHAGNFCHIPITLAGAPHTALVDNCSTATLVRSDVVPAEMQLEPTAVKLRTVTGALAPMLGRGVVAIQVGGLLVNFKVWVAAVQDPCILGFLRAARCVLDLGKNTRAFPRGPTVEMVHPTQTAGPHLTSSRTTEERHVSHPEPQTTLSPPQSPITDLPEVECLPAQDEQPLVECGTDWQ